MLLTKLLVLHMLLLQFSIFTAVEAVYENGSHSVWTNITHESAHQEVKHGEGQEVNITHESAHQEVEHGEGQEVAHHGVHVASIKYYYVKQPLIISVFLIFVALCKVGFHHADFLSNWMPESCVLIVLGVVAGGIFKAIEIDMSDLNYIEPSPFFLVLLPPCVLEAAYGLHDKAFFDNLGTVLVYAVLGTLVNFFIIGPVLYALAICGAMGPIDISAFECLVFASFIVAVDPVAVLAIFQEVGVNSVLYFLVFGESLLNDAVTVVLYNTICVLAEMPGTIPADQYVLACVSFFVVSLGGCAVGFIYGFISALVTKVTSQVRVVEPLVILVLAYASYITAELFHFSGIIRNIFFDILGELHIQKENCWITGAVHNVLIDVLKICAGYFCKGMTVKPLVNLLNVEKDKEKTMSLCQEITDHVFDHLLVFIEDLIGNYGRNKFQLWTNNLDDKVFKRFLLKDPFTKDEVIMEVYQQVMMQQQYEELYGETESSSQIQLYKHTITEEDEETPLDQEVLRRSMNVQAELIRRSMNIQSKAMWRTTSKETAAKPIKFPLSKAEKTLPTTDPKARRQSVKKERDELNKMLKSGPSSNVYAKTSDRNMKGSNKDDLLDLLQEKHNRHSRAVSTMKASTMKASTMKASTMKTQKK